MSGSVRVGCDGWPSGGSASLRGTGGERADATLAALGEQTDLIEVQSSFATLPSAAQIARWCEAVPTQFRFMVTVPRRISHEKRLRECAHDLGLLQARMRCFGGRAHGLLFRMPERGIGSAERIRDLVGTKAADAYWVFDVAGTAWDTPAIHRALVELGADTVVTKEEALGFGRDAPPRIYARLDMPGIPAARDWANRASAWAHGGSRVSLICTGKQAGNGARQARALRRVLDDAMGATRRRSAVR